MKKSTICYFVIILLLMLLLLLWYSNRIIGRMSGPENERVILNNSITYEICNDFHTNFDIGWILGKITGSYKTTYYVFSVQGDLSHKYIYVAAMGRGEFYKKIE